ncbi:MAG: hypothetical protein LBH06_05905 [Rikenellaceae bacterium]|nr:hypothetical protein [Rikenellaceae bacterium]
MRRIITERSRHVSRSEAADSAGRLGVGSVFGPQSAEDVTGARGDRAALRVARLRAADLAPQGRAKQQVNYDGR